MPEAEQVPADVAALYRWLDIEALGYQEFPFEATAEALKVSPGASGSDQGRRLGTGPAVRAERQESALGTDTGSALASLAKEEMLPERMPAGRVSQLRWRIFEGHTNGRHAEKNAAVGARTGQQQPGTTETQEAKAAELRSAVDVYAQAKPYTEDQSPVQAKADPKATDPGAPEPSPDAGTPVRAEAVKGRAGEDVIAREAHPEMPAWIGTYAQQHGAGRRKEVSGESLIKTRERIAARWFGLRGVLKARIASAAEPFEAEREAVPPVLVLFSMAGGTGKSTLAASLTRALAAQGERVLLVSLSGAEVLPYFFGAGEVKPGEKRVFAPPPGVADAPVHLWRGDRVYPKAGSDETDLLSRFKQESKGFSRVIVDAGSGELRTVEALLGLGGCVLVPLLPDMNSLVSLSELRGVMAKEGGRPGQLWCVLTQFSAAQPLHLDIREVLEQELADRLLPMAIRSSPAVPEALAQGMTVIDYAPADGVAQDLQQLAAWVRTLREPAREGLGQVRWSERR